MKKIILGFTFLMTIISVSSFAQQMKGGAMMQNMKQQLKDSVGLSEAQADSVISIHEQFMPQMHAAMSDSSSAKASRLQAIRSQQQARISAILTPDQITKLNAYMKNMMAQRMNKKKNAQSSNN